MKNEQNIQTIESSTELHIEWNNRRTRPDSYLFWFFVFFWSIWTPATIAATSMIFRSGSPTIPLSIWCFFGWLGTLGIPYMLLQRFWCEWLTISPDSIVFGQRGILAPKSKRIPLEAVDEIGIGHYDSGETESAVTLNIKYHTSKKRRARRIVGYWLHPTLKEQVFHAVEQFAGRQQLAIPFKRY